MKSSTRSGKIKIVLDTNIIISALLCSEGSSAKILEKIIAGEIESFTSSGIIEELREVLDRKEVKERVEKRARFFLLENFYGLSEIVEPEGKIDVVREHKADNKFIEVAVEAGAKYLVTGDRHLLKVGGFKSVNIVKPKRFLEILEGLV
ncbi:MAG: putative toxin-antitoxin system toxin component, PIN family [Candidatus Diapherotrites archaeon]